MPDRRRRGRTPGHPWRQGPFPSGLSASADAGLAEPGHPARSLAAPQLVLGFDFGLRRIGIAAGDTLTATAAPRPAAYVTRGAPDWTAIAREIDALKPRRLIVGAPYNVDGTPGALAAAARRFANELERRFKLPVSLVDERWSSLEAGAALKARRASDRGRIRREDVDSAAAAVILERWLAGEDRDNPDGRSSPS